MPTDPINSDMMERQGRDEVREKRDGEERKEKKRDVESTELGRVVEGCAAVFVGGCCKPLPKEKAEPPRLNYGCTSQPPHHHQRPF